MWQSIEIQSLCSRVCSGGTPKSTCSEYYSGAIPWLNTKEIHFEPIWKTEKSISQLGLENSSAKWIPANSVVVAMYGATAAKACITKIPLTTNQACCNLIIDESRADHRFVYYAIKNRYKELAALANGGAQQNLNAQQIKAFQIECPPIDIQQKIASILESFDDKIYINNRINDYLVRLKQIKYQQLKSEIVGQSLSLKHFVKETIGGDWGKDEPLGNYIKKVLCVRGADIPELAIGNQGKAPIRYILLKNFDKKALKENDIIVEVSGGSPTQSTGRATLISKATQKRFKEDLICTNFCRVIRPINNYAHYLNACWHDLYQRGIFFNYENGTTGIKNLDLSAVLYNEEVLAPDREQLSEFNAFCESIDAQIFANGSENVILRELRDSLLPKLLSGEIRLTK